LKQGGYRITQLSSLAMVKEIGPQAVEDLKLVRSADEKDTITESSAA
jgi:hypothetical protein